jgi:hypothetical protein
MSQRKRFKTFTLWIARAWRQFADDLFRVAFVVERVDELPSRLKRDRVYVVGEKGHTWYAAVVCPCGCGVALEMNLTPPTRPCWTLLEHGDGTVTLSPSVWRQNGCGSHFLLQRGQVKWVPKT